MDQTNFLEQLIQLLDEQAITYCVIGGQAVNAYVEPLVSLDLDLVVATQQIDEVEGLLGKHFLVKKFPHSLNISLVGSNLRVQIQTDARYAAFVGRANSRTVLGITLPVASMEDVLKGKIWVYQDPERRGSKRQKDLADISRMIEAFPALRAHVPEEILLRIID